MTEQILNYVRGLIPITVFRWFQRPYHWLLSLSAAVLYGFPSKRLKVIAVTGTKGKSSTVELVSAILEKSGKKTALSDTIRFKVGDRSWRNLHKMSMPGRFFMQRLLRQAVRAGCDYAIIEMTSQGSLLFRHRWIELDTLVFTNLSPEHIEAHGSYESYADAKLAIARNISRSGKKPTTIIANADDKESSRFLECRADRKISYRLKDAEPYEIRDSGIGFTLHGRRMQSPLSGEFNLYNILGAAACAESEGASLDDIAQAVEAVGTIPGRVEKIEAGQDFEVVVDYAHTPDSLEKLYRAFRRDPAAPRAGGRKLIGVLGGTGGGRDSWKRAEMGKLADLYCDKVILTDEDPYDEDPRKIVDDVVSGVRSKEPIIIMDRREAIREAVRAAKRGDAVLITGKGTDPYIMGPKGSKEPWSDADVAREEIVRQIGRDE